MGAHFFGSVQIRSHSLENGTANLHERGVHGAREWVVSRLVYYKISRSQLYINVRHLETQSSVGLMFGSSVEPRNQLVVESSLCIIQSQWLTICRSDSCRDCRPVTFECNEHYVTSNNAACLTMDCVTSRFLEIAMQLLAIILTLSILHLSQRQCRVVQSCRNTRPSCITEKTLRNARDCSSAEFSITGTLQSP